MSANPASDEYTHILDVLKDHPLGMSIKEIAAAVSMSRNSMAKYLDVLSATGQLELRHVGNAKLYSLSVRVPISDVLNHARELIVLLDNDLRIIQASAPFCMFTGIPREHILHARMSSLTVPFLTVADEREIVSLLNGGPLWKKEIRISRNGTEMYFEGRFIPTVLENGLHGITVILEDVTERYIARKVSDERERLLHTLFQIPTAPQFFIDRNHKVVYWDRTLEILTGIKAEDIVGTTGQWRAFYTHQRRCLADMLIDGDLEAIRSEYPSSVIPTSDGKYECTDFFSGFGLHGKWLHITAALIYDTNGMVTGAMETIEDVSDKKSGNFFVQR